MNYYQQKRKHSRLSLGHDGNALTMLIAINLIAFVILAFIKVVYYFSEHSQGLEVFNRNFFQWVTLPADMSRLAERPWTIITHMFVHDTTNIWHIVGNMLWLWAFGYILQDLTGNKKIIQIFLYGALAGALFYLLAFNFLNPLKEQVHVAHAYGASAGIMAIAIATTTLAPNYRIFTMLNGGIPIWVVTVLYLVLDLSMIPESNAGGHIAHLAGGAMGFCYILLLNRGTDIGEWMNRFYDWLSDLFNPDKPKKTGKPTQLYYKANVQPFKKKINLTQQKVDEILDKINQRGYESLSEDEKEALKRASKEDLL